MNPTAIQLAGCLIFNSQNKLLLIHRQKGDKDQWETPGGKIDPGETANQAAIRKIKEEIGIIVKLTHKVGDGDFTEGNQPYHYTWFQAVINSGTPALAEPQTFTELNYFSWDEMKATKDQLSAGTQTLTDLHRNHKLTLENL